MADDVVPVSIVTDSAAAGGSNAASAPPPRRPPSPMPAGAVANSNHTPVFRELPPRANSHALLNFDLVRDVELTVKIELGRTRMRLEEVLRLGPGALVELDRLAGDPVDVFVNDRLVARGEVVVLNEKFAVRLTEVVSPIKDD
jgi:flagellar motor switch protein FliN/FliY